MKITIGNVKNSTITVDAVVSEFTAGDIESSKLIVGGLVVEDTVPVEPTPEPTPNPSTEEEVKTQG